MPIYRKLLIALILGAVLGSLSHPLAHFEWIQLLNTHVLQPIGQIFLRMIFMVVIPLLISALILGVLELGSSNRVGRIAGKTLFYTLIASGLSVVVGITFVNLVRPGDGLVLPKDLIQGHIGGVGQIEKQAAEAKSISQVLVELIPKNPIQAAANALEGEILSLMVFALIFGLALTQVRREFDAGQTLISFFEDLYKVSMKVIDYAMLIAPFGVFALVFNSVFVFGVTILTTVLSYALLVVAAILFQQFVVYSAMLKFIGGIAPFDFYRKCREVYLYAFSTASSNATLPKSLETAENALGLPKDISRFVLTIGSTANQNGTALFEGITVLFLAQVYHIDLSLTQQLQVVLMSILAGVGTAGVPGGSLPLIAILLQSLGIPLEGLGLILGIDRFLDMCRTTLNVSGDLVITALVSKNQPASNSPS